MVEATFQPRRTCAGNCEDVRTRGEQLDRTRLWTVDIDHSKGAIGGTVEDAIRRTMTNEIDLTCKQCKKMGKEGKMGRIWLRLRDAPEIFFIRISRFERTKRGRLYRKCNNEVAVPEILDMTPHLEESDKQAGVEARYRLCGAINHAGTMDSGHFVSHVRGPNRQWYRLDDQTVTDSSIATLNDDPAKFGKHKFTPYVLAFTRVFDDDVSPDPPLRQLTPPPTPAKTEAKFRIRVNIADQVFTMTRKLKHFCAITESQEVNLHADIVDADGAILLEAEPMTIELAMKTSESNSTSSKTKKAKPSPLRTPKKPLPETGLVTPSPTPIRTKTKTKTSRSKGEDSAKVCKRRQELGGQAHRILSPLSPSTTT
jgi:Ubiquitin carboxyl-terminal hydrolase